MPLVTLLNKTATIFERRFLYGYGRHFWNFLGVVGFVLMAVGGIFAIESQVSFDNLSEEDREQYKTDFSSWVLKSPESLEYFSTPGASNGAYKRDWNNREYLISSDGADLTCFNALLQYAPYSDYVNRWCNQKGVSVDPLFQKWTNFSRSDGGKSMKAARLMMSPMIAGSGLLIISYVSVVSAILSIERNTRKD